MKPFAILRLFLLFVLSATELQAQSAMTPREFTHQLSAITDTLSVRGQDWGQQFTKVNTSKAFSSLKPYRQSIEVFVNRSISRLKVMKDVENSKELRMAMISLMEYEKKMVAGAFIPIEHLKSTASEDEILIVYNQLIAYSKEESAVLEQLNIAHEAYAAANGITVEAAPAGEKP